MNPEPNDKQPALDHELSLYLSERKAYQQLIKSQPTLKRRYAKEMAIYLIRRLMWSFGFFPVFMAFWIPLVLARFNPVAMISDMLPALERFVNANPEVQSATIHTFLLSWLSIGFLFTLFDFILTPFKSPIEQEIDIHMRAWQRTQSTLKEKNEKTSPTLTSDESAVRDQAAG